MLLRAMVNFQVVYYHDQGKKRKTAVDGTLTVSSDGQFLTLHQTGAQTSGRGKVKAAKAARAARAAKHRMRPVWGKGKNFRPWRFMDGEQ